MSIDPALLLLNLRIVTTMHVVFSVTWIYMTGVFGTALWFVAR